MSKLSVPLKSVVKVERNPDLATKNLWSDRTEKKIPLNVPTFPELVCDSEGRHLAVIHEGKRIDDPLLAYCVALVKYGYENFWGYYEMPKSGTFDPPKGPAGNYPEPKPSLTEACQIREDKYRGKHLHFPMLLAGGRGYRGVYFGPDDEGNAVLACYIAMIQQGIRLKHYDNYLESTLWDDTPEHIEKLTRIIKGDISFPKVIKDSGWEFNTGSSSPGRGIRDYDRYVEFGAPLSTEQMKLVQDLLHHGAFFDTDGNVVESKCPGWTGIMVRSSGGARYRFLTTYDSSD